ncbi:MAG: hypothetical protein ACK55X_12055 [Synechococcaceae cyanobacterium]
MSAFSAAAPLQTPPLGCLNGNHYRPQRAIELGEQKKGGEQREGREGFLWRGLPLG